MDATSGPSKPLDIQTLACTWFSFFCFASVGRTEHTWNMLKPTPNGRQGNHRSAQRNVNKMLQHGWTMMKPWVASCKLVLIWLVVSTPLKNIKVSCSPYSQYMENNPNVPNHQAVMILIIWMYHHWLHHHFCCLVKSSNFLRARPFTSFTHHVWIWKQMS